MNIADKYFIETLKELKESSNIDVNPRAKYKDRTPAHTKFIIQKIFTYDISKGEFPINTLRNTAIKGGWYDIEAIYIKQTNIIEEMHPSIHSWWKDFSVRKQLINDGMGEPFWTENTFREKNNKELLRDVHSIGATYGHTVQRYDLMNNLLNGLEFNPFSRRHIINLWQEQQMIEDPVALVPCCYETLWSIRDEIYLGDVLIRYIDLTLNQRSMDYLMTSSINPTQYVMFGMAICGHLTQVTGIKHQLGVFIHHIQNLHVYDRHLWAIDELLSRETKEQPKIELLANKNFYDYTIEDFKITFPKGIEKLSKELELAI
jgi:thymidylate synthase